MVSMIRSAGAGVLLTSLLLLAGGCPAGRDPAVVDDSAVLAELDPPPGATPREQCQAYYREALLVEGETRQDLQGELGEPAEAQVTTEPNRHVPHATDTLTVLRFDAVEAQIRTAMGSDLLERITVLGNRHLRYAPAIGTSQDELLALFGEPDRREADRLEYLCAPEPMPDVPVSFTVRQGEVREVTFHRYVD
jgi:hypothetical protein